MQGLVDAEYAEWLGRVPPIAKSVPPLSPPIVFEVEDRPDDDRLRLSILTTDWHYSPGRVRRAVIWESGALAHRRRIITVLKMLHARQLLPINVHVIAAFDHGGIALVMDADDGALAAYREQLAMWQWATGLIHVAPCDAGFLALAEALGLGHQDAPAGGEGALS